MARALARHLPSLGRPIVTLARPAHDLERPQSLVGAIIAARPLLVINAAAYTAVDTAEDEPHRAYTVNAYAAGVIATAARSIGAPILHFSTDYVFDGAKRTPYVETDPVGPIGAYGATKLAGEQAVAAGNPAHVILRTSWVASPDGHNFVKTMLRLGAERPLLKVVDDQHGAPTFADNLAAAAGGIAVRLASLGPTGGRPEHGIFHCASAGSTTWCGFARAIMAGAQARGRGPMAKVEPITTADYPTKARRPAYSKLATGKLEAVYGIALPAWQTGLEQCLDSLIGAPVPQTG